MGPTASGAQDGSQTPSDKAELYKTAANVAKDSVMDQLAEVDSIRQRSVQFLAFIGTATAFLVGTAASGPANDRSDWFLYVGIAASVGMLALLLLFRSILTGSLHWYGGESMKWNMRQDVTAYTEWLDEVSPPASTFYRYMTTVYTDQYNNNRPYLAKLRARYMVFLSLSMVSLFIWGVLAWAFGGGP